MAVPEVLLSGDHGAVARWRREQSEARSRSEAGSSSKTDSSERKEGNHEE
jgi:tRNA G37 N-methylase TrmD